MTIVTPQTLYIDLDRNGRLDDVNLTYTHVDGKHVFDMSTSTGRKSHMEYTNAGIIDGKQPILAVLGSLTEGDKDAQVIQIYYDADGLGFYARTTSK